ncbi:MAG: MBG domain-containing protein, partial [Prolixibacteraceae bacterium]|nr:MBG domain-containing protein [Prolixibacteraceae bacterium]
GTGKTVSVTAISISGTDAANYAANTTTTTTATITQRDLAVTATGPAKTYGSALTAGVSSTDFTAVGMVNSETVTSVTLTPDAAGLSSTTTAGTSYVVTPSLATGTNGFIAGNYNINYTGYNGTVAKKVLTVTADAKSKTYDGSVFTPFTSTITGFVNGELAGDVVSGTVTYSGTAIAAVNAGHYNIVPLVTGLSATNYSFEAVNGELTINSPSSGGGGGGSSDTTPPVWITASASLDRTIEYGDATGLAAAQALKPVASDASSFVLTKVSGSFVQSPDCIYAGTYTNTWTAKDSYGNISKVFTQVINIDKTYNEQPKIDQVNDLYVYKNSKEAEVSLSGIDPTSGCIPQEIVSIIAVTSNSSLITNISVVYTKGSTSGKLVLKIAENLEGESLIKVTLKDNGGIAGGASDTKDMTFKIKVVGVDQGPKLTSEIPVQIVNPGNSFQSNLNDFFEANDGKPFTYTATLANGFSLPSWMVFNPQTGIISGVAPQNDLGSYQIFVTVRDIHGLTNQTSFWMVNSTSGSYMVSGSISSKAGPVTGGIQVILLKIGDNNQTTIVEKINLNGSSSFVFSNLSSGNYLLNAVVTDVNKHPDLLNTYYNGSNSVYTAQRIELKSNSEIQLLMLNKEVFTGNGSISGLVIRKTGPAASGSTQTGVSAPDVDIVLKRDGKVVANTSTDLEGKYSFISLPVGKYIVEAEVLGYKLEVVQNVTVQTDIPDIKNVNFTLWATGSIITEIEDIQLISDAKMFPNPTSGQLNIVSGKNGFTTITVFNAEGREVFRDNYLSGESISINLSSQVSGFYFVKLESEGESVIRKIVLKK